MEYLYIMSHSHIIPIESIYKSASIAKLTNHNGAQLKIEECNQMNHIQCSLTNNTYSDFTMEQNCISRYSTSKDGFIALKAMETFTNPVINRKRTSNIPPSFSEVYHIRKYEQSLLTKLNIMKLEVD